LIDEAGYEDLLIAGGTLGSWSLEFAYDKVSRLTNAKVSTSRLSTGSLVQQDYAYDAFGNMQEIIGSPGRATPTSSSTNRLTGAVTYSDAGNLTSWNGNDYEYDAFHMMTQLTSGAENYLYVYTADDERIWQFRVRGTGPAHRYTLRDLSGLVLREYSSESDFWAIKRDYVYRGGQLLAAETPDGRRHFHLDHLGTPRLITAPNGSRVAYHVYFPFGEEATEPLQDQERMKFTGHERDLANLSGTGDDLDYMHARFCSPVTGRFMSVDPVLQLDRAPRMPQLWNRYTYAVGNPLKYVDPTGEAVSIRINFKGDDWTAELKEAVIAKVQQFWEGLDVGDVFVFDGSQGRHGNFFGGGRATITADSGAKGRSNSRTVRAGEFLGAPGLLQDEQLNAVANAINHEVFTHQFRINDRLGAQDFYVFSRHLERGVEPEIKSRYGTVLDSHAWNDPLTRGAFVNGPVSVHGGDAAEAQQLLRPIFQAPPRGLLFPILGF
jgi:RHS repeat-associated protein